ncbi:protein TolR [Mangrovicoccus algicola]|uniref:Protein TolR n=1 Tax=Mangrovicoccus algicola TaxID=2771008 RepID=A0A8J6Z2V6_9RHOB|nr:protein TolR [Mangrovicoccus algicola]MBE3640703.1 protein TolR [Mangrovicoccus algicola]
MRSSAGGGGRGSRRRRSHAHTMPMSEINVTPFVDVMLVLLVVFMVAAPLMTVGVPIELPETAAEPLPMPEEEPLTITLQADGGMAIQTTEIAAEELIPRLTAIAEERTDRQLFLRADQGISYGQVMQVMGALNAAGFTRIGLVTEDGGPTMGAE